MEVMQLADVVMGRLNVVVIMLCGDGCCQQATLMVQVGSHCRLGLTYVMVHAVHNIIMCTLYMFM